MTQRDDSDAMAWRQRGITRLRFSQRGYNEATAWLALVSLSPLALADFNVKPVPPQIFDLDMF